MREMLPFHGNMMMAEKRKRPEFPWQGETGRVPADCRKAREEAYEQEIEWEQLRFPCAGITAGNRGASRIDPVSRKAAMTCAEAVPALLAVTLDSCCAGA